MRSIRLYLDILTMINIYYTFFNPHLIYGDEFYGQAANCHSNPIYLLQKSALCVILASRPRNHVSSYFSEFKMMPINLTFKYKFLILFHRSRLGGEINVKLPLQNKITRSRAEFVLQRANTNIGERPLLTTGVNLWNAHHMGGKATGLPALRGQLIISLSGCGSSLTG